MITKEQFFDYLKSYEGISECIKNHSIAEILSLVSELFSITVSDLANKPMGGYSKGRKSGAYYFVLNDLKKNIDYYDWLYHKLTDSESKRVFQMLISFRLLPDFTFIKSAYDGKHPQYFDTDIVKCDKNEVFVDCGGYIGDTVQSYIDTYKDYKKIYVYEPDPENYKKASLNLHQYENVSIKNAGVGDRNELVGFSSDDSAGSFLASDESSTKTQLISIDEDIDEPVTYIKMDIEGFEIPAIIGAKNHIKNDHPKLAICLYHIVSDLWEIPKLIDSIYSGYQFYIRHYEEKENWETVLYAIPPQKRPLHNEFHTAATICPNDRPWLDVELTKDCGLIPYLFHKKYGMDVQIIGTDKDSEYPSYKYVNGVKLVSLPGNDSNTKLDYISKHAKEIDLLILYGGYYLNAHIAIEYKKYNPNGLIYCALDANSHWMDKFEYTQKFYQDFLDACDVLAASCTAMSDYLSKKWHRKIDLITNGYYDFTGDMVSKKDFTQKEDIILTVGRIGTEQKRTNILMEAFALIANDIPGWTLKLVGPIEESFNDYITTFYNKYPQLKERIVFAGSVFEKTKLLEIYEHSKIFALPSWYEGAPNVIAESLTCGCVSAVTKFDAYADCIDNGRCGLASEIDDVQGFAYILKELCTRSNLQQLSEHARKYASDFYDMDKNVENIHNLLMGAVNNRR